VSVAGLVMSAERCLGSIGFSNTLLSKFKDKRFAVQQSHPSMSSRRSSRDPNASSFNLFTGEETSGGPQTTQRTTSQKTASTFNLFTGEEINGPDFAYQQQYQQQQRAPSSNVWASNQSQNCGNMLSERPSTFVSQAPGGRSSFTIGDPDMCASTRARAAYAPPPTHLAGSTIVSPRTRTAPPFSRAKITPRTRNHPTANNSSAICCLCLAQLLHVTFVCYRYGVPVKSSRCESSNSWARNDSQNSGNYITDRPSTRVVNPPGIQSWLPPLISPARSPCPMQAAATLWALPSAGNNATRIPFQSNSYFTNFGRRPSAIQGWPARATTRSVGIHYNYGTPSPPFATSCKIIRYWSWRQTAQHASPIFERRQ
jgi:hypothetical protein